TRDRMRRSALRQGRSEGNCGTCGYDVGSSVARDTWGGARTSQEVVMRSSLAAFTLPLCATCLLLEAPPAQQPLPQKVAPDHFAASRNARAAGRFGMLLRQFKADEPALAEHHEAGFRGTTQVYQG